MTRPPDPDPTLAAVLAQPGQLRFRRPDRPVLDGVALGLGPEARAQLGAIKADFRRQRDEVLSEPLRAAGGMFSKPPAYDVGPLAPSDWPSSEAILALAASIDRASTVLERIATALERTDVASDI